MDEPTSSISDKEVGFLFDTMRALTQKGVGIIYISHKMSELEEICDRVTVMRDGQTVGTKVVKETNTINGFSIASLVLGIVSLALWCFWMVSIPCSILALIFGIIAIKKPGKGMAIAGVVTGAIALAIWFFSFCGTFMMAVMSSI